MAAEPVRLFDSHGNRYTPADREAAYVSWKVASGRSLRKTADLTGISVSTLAGWSKDDGWQERARREDAEDAESLRSALRGLHDSEALKSLRTAAALRDDESGKTPPKVRLDASIWLAGIAGIAPVKKTLDLTEPSRDKPKAVIPEDLSGLSVEELVALEAQLTAPE